MNKYWFTFGSNHTTADGESLGQCVCVIEAGDEHDARAMMHEARGRKWSHNYESAEAAGVAEWGLVPVELADIWIPKEQR